MQLAVTITPIRPARLPFSYYQYLSAALYQALAAVQPDLASDLYRGELYDGRIKLFGFSPLHSRRMTVKRGGRGSHLLGGIQVEGGRPSLLVEGDCTFRFYSPWPELLSAISEGLPAGNSLRLSQNEFAIQSTKILPEPDFQETMLWQPVHESSFVTSWQPREKGRKIYALPDKSAEGHESTELLKQNLLHKWVRFTDETGRPDIAARWAGLESQDPAEAKAWLSGQEVDVEIAGPARIRLFHIKRNPVRSWSAPLKITAPIALQRFIWATGLGEMNSMGFGCIKASEAP